MTIQTQLMEQYIDNLGGVLSQSTVNVLPPEVAKQLPQLAIEKDLPPILHNKHTTLASATLVEGLLFLLVQRIRSPGYGKALKTMGLEDHHQWYQDSRKLVAGRIVRFEIDLASRFDPCQRGGEQQPKHQQQQ